MVLDVLLQESVARTSRHLKLEMVEYKFRLSQITRIIHWTWLEHSYNNSDTEDHSVTDGDYE